MTLRGGCHCRAVELELTTALDPTTTVPRACDCSFCRKHGAAWVSDAAGALAIVAREGSLVRYRQGSNTADFLLCGRCGVLVAVVLEEEGARRGAVNAGCLDADFAPAQCASPQKLARDDKVERWRRLWIQHVTIDAH